MRRTLASTLPLALPLALASSLAVVWACSGGDGTTPAAPPDAAGDAFVPVADAGPDVTTPAVNDPACTADDREAGAGPRFCDLPGTDTPDLTLPADFCAREYATTPVAEARVLRFAPNGDLFVAAPSMDTAGGAADGLGSIVVLPDDDHDGKADSITTYAGPYARNGTSCVALEGDTANLACVHGLAFAGGYLYFTRSDEVRRVPYTPGDRAMPSSPSELVAKLGGDGRAEMRWTHTLEVDKKGSLLVSRGVYFLPACDANELKKGAVLALHIEDPSLALPLVPEVVGDGFRNPMYIRCAPNSCGDCYANELTDDGWDGIGAREKVALLEPRGQSWGFPCCVGPGQLAPGITGHDCSTAAPERVAIPLHDTPFGLDFDRGLWPAPYTHGMFSAIHGVVSSFGGTGVIFMKTDPRSLRPTGEAVPFIKGFRPRGRAADVAFAPDGRLFIADDTEGRIFWVAPRSLAMPR